MRALIFLLCMALAMLPLAGCATTANDSGDWAAIVIDLQPADTLPAEDLDQTMERPWIGFGLARQPDSTAAATTDAAAPAPAPSTLQIRLRTGALSAADPQGEQLDMIQVHDADIGRPRTAEGALPGPMVIALDPPAASLTFTGATIDWPYGSDAGPVVGGVARITLHPGFIDAARQADPDVTAEALLRAALIGVHTADLRQYNQLAVRPTLAQIVQLVQAQVSPAVIQSYDAAGYAFTAQQFILLKQADVSVDDAVAFADAGFAFTADDLVRLRTHSVSPAYAIGLDKAGFAGSVDLLVALRTEGIEPAYAQRMRKLGVTPTADDLVLLHRGGITPQSVETFQKAMYDPSAAELITLKQAGVSADDTLALREAGYDFTLDDLILLARWRVPTRFSLSLVSEEFEHLSADQIVNLRLRRITPEMVRLLRRPRGASPVADADDQITEIKPTVIAPPLTPLAPLTPLEPAGSD